MYAECGGPLLSSLAWFPEFGQPEDDELVAIKLKFQHPIRPHFESIDCGYSLGVKWLVSHGRQGHPTTQAELALAIFDKRFAKGALARAEFLTAKRDVGD